MKDKNFKCQDCEKEFWEKAFTPEVVALKLCPQCYTKRVTKDISLGKGVTIHKKDLMKKIKSTFRKLTDDDRLEIFSDYCRHCGVYDKDKPRRCQCWNDE